MHLPSLVPAVFCDALLGLFIIFPVFQHHAVSPDHQLPLSAQRHHLSCSRVHYFCLMEKQPISVLKQIINMHAGHIYIVLCVNEPQCGGKYIQQSPSFAPHCQSESRRMSQGCFRLCRTRSVPKESEALHQIAQIHIL